MHKKTSARGSGPVQAGSGDRPRAVFLFLFAAAYVVAGGFGQGLPLIPGVSITFWPPAGIFVTALLWNPRRYWPWYVVVAGLAELACNAIWFRNPVPFALLYFAANALEALTAAWLVGRFVPRPFRFASARQVATFAALAAGVAPVVGATVIATIDAIIGKHPFTIAWPLVWLGDATGLLVSTPIALAFGQAWSLRHRLSGALLLEAVAVAALVVGVGALAFLERLPTAYMTMPFVLWAAMRFQWHGAAVAVGLVALTTAGFTARGAGEFSGTDEQVHAKVVMLQTFLGVTAFSALLAAALSERLRKATNALKGANLDLERRIQERTQSLREREHFLQRITDVSPGVLHIFDLEERRNIFVNRSVATLIGYTAAEIEEMGSDVVPKLMHPDDLPRFEAHMQRVLGLADEEFADFEHRMRDRAGGWHWFHNRDTVFSRNASGGVRQLIGAAFEITERKRAEEKLHERAGQLDLLARTAQRLIGSGAPSHELLAEIFTDIGQLIGVESFFHFQPLPGERRLRLEICGGASEEEQRYFGSMKFGELLCGRVAETCQRIIIEDLQESTLPGSEALHAAGAQSYAGFPLLDTRGALLGTLAFMSKRRTHFREGDVQMIVTVCAQVGVTLERARLLSELRESQERLALATEAAGLGVWEWTPATDVTYWEDAWPHKILGLAVTDTPLGAARFVNEFVHPEDGERFEAALSATVRGSAPFRFQGRVRRPDGEERWIEFTGKGVPGATPEEFRLLGTAQDITLQRQAAETMQRNASLFADLIEQAPVGVVVLDADLRFQQVNTEAMPLYKNVSPLIGREFGEVTRILWGAEVGALCAGVFRHTLETGERYVSPHFTETRHDTGEQQTFEWETQRLTLPDGRHGVVCYFHEETERERALRELSASEQRMRLATEATGVGIWEWHVRSGRVRWDAEMFRIYGVTRTEGGVVSYETWRGAVLPEDIARQEEVLQDTLRRRGKSEREFRIRRASDGECRRVQAVETVRLDAQGAAEWVVGTNLDVTERHRLLEENQEALARVRGILRQSPAGIVQTDAEGRMTLVNARWCEMLGCTEAELLGRSVVEVTHPVSRELTVEKVTQLAAGGPDFQMEKIYIRKDGTPLQAQSNVTAVRSADGQFLGLIAVVLDITERLRAEEAVRDEAKRKDEFLAMLGHELRNPLNAIRHAVQIAHESPDDREACRWADGVIDRQSQQLSRMVDDLLDVARINRGRIELRPETIDVATVLERALAVVRPLIEERRHTLTTELSRSLCVTGDAARLEQVFVNLLNNAAKYTPEGGSISVRAQREDGEVLVKIADTGIGIPGELLPHVFDLFRQADSSLDRSLGGLGIGLNVVKSLVEMHLGRVTVESAGAGQGTTVTVRLPLLIEMQMGSAFDAPVATAPALPQATRVLIVDDHQDAANALARLLQRRGCEVRCAHTGPDGATHAREFHPEILLLDLGLPGFDGYELARILRAEAPFANALFIAISGYAQDADRQRSVAAGFDAHFAKPLELSDLLAAIGTRCGV